MNIDEFIAASKADLDRFREVWVSGDPTKYPAELGEGDWFEQFLAFITTDKGASGAWRSNKESPHDCTFLQRVGGAVGAGSVPGQ